MSPGPAVWMISTQASQLSGQGWGRKGFLPSTTKSAGSQGSTFHKGASPRCGPLTAQCSQQRWASLPLHKQRETARGSAHQRTRAGSRPAPQQAANEAPWPGPRVCALLLGSASVLGSLLSPSFNLHLFLLQVELYLVYSQKTETVLYFSSNLMVLTWDFENLCFWFHAKADSSDSGHSGLIIGTAREGP